VPPIRVSEHVADKEGIHGSLLPDGTRCGGSLATALSAATPDVRAA